LAYPAGCDTHPDYKDEDEFMADLEKKRLQARNWGFDSFTYCYAREQNVLALIMRSSRDIIIAFRGTVVNNFSNWWVDLQALPVPFDHFGKVHKGFLEAMQSIWGKIKSAVPHTEKRNIWVTGHSMGAALALLAGAFFVKEYRRGMIKAIYTFGQPRVGDDDFKKAIAKSYLHRLVTKFAHYNDMVTVVPPHVKKIMEYVDVGQIVYFNQEGLWEFKDRLSEFRTAKDFLTGYFHLQRLAEPESEDEAPVKDWDTFKRFFTGKFRQKEVTEKTGEAEDDDWDGFKDFFTKKLIRLPHPQRSEKMLQIVMALFVKLFIKINPYGVHTHSMSTYIDLLEKNSGIDFQGGEITRI
jgi:hypothetical protein